MNRTGFADAIELSDAEVIVDRLEASTAPMTVAQLRVARRRDGARARRSHALAHRDRCYDPTNLFRLKQNIPPATS